MQAKFPLSGNPITGEGYVSKYFKYLCADTRFVTSSGPFTLAVGDTQEVVIAQIAAQGKDRLNSVALLKYYSSILQRDYPNNISDDPKQNLSNYIPDITESENSESGIIELSIDRNEEIETFSENGYTFQGYKLYQFHELTNNSLSGLEISTYDISDNITNINGETYDPLTGYIITDLVFNGTNSGLVDIITIDKDNINDSKLLKGKPYYWFLLPVSRCR